MIRRPPKSPLFPYPTLSRSPQEPAVGIGVVQVVAETREPPILERAEVHVVAEGPGGGDGERERQGGARRSEEHTSELQSPCNLVCRLLLEKKKQINQDRC